jgi:LuxR family transcriptional regulator, maltose regulon positive regulatory protein
MADLLHTKLSPPRLRAALVPREALLALLDDGLERKLTLLSAPAGFGKTTLVRHWIASRSSEFSVLSSELDQSHQLKTENSKLKTPVAWLSLDSGDDDPVRFLRYVIAACQSFQADLGASALGPLDVAQQPRFEAVLTSFINDLALLDRRCVLVLEDYHTITARQVHELVAFLLDHLPATLHIMLLTRSDPPLPLARLRAQDELRELRAADLRFSPAETRAFLQQAMPLSLSAEAIARLDARIEGWVAGLRLAALALQGRPATQDVEHILATFAGSHRHVVEYLVADVLDAQPAAQQEFLLKTASLSRLTASLCDAVTSRDDSAAILDQLEHANLFVFEVGDQGPEVGSQAVTLRPPTSGLHPPVYRYHALFAEAMQHEAQRRLGAAALHDLHERASCWYEEHGLLAEAIEAALAARSFARAAALIERIVAPQRFYNELHTLRRWIEALPEELLRDRPALCFAYAPALLFTEDRRAPATMALIQVPLRLAEERWRAEGNQSRLGEALAFRALVAWWQGDLTQAFTAARQALGLLPEDENQWRGISLLTLGLEELLAGQVEAAWRSVLAARAHCQAAGNNYGARAATYILGDMRAQQGQLGQAEQLYRQVLAEAGDDLVDQAHALIGLAALAYERNDLETAERNVSQALDIGRQQAEGIDKLFVEEVLLGPGTLLLARVLHARGAGARARELLHELAAQTLQHGWSRLHREALAWQARLALAEGDLAAAQRWATDRAQRGDDTPLVEQERDALIVARLLIAQGEAGSALRALDRWRITAHDQGRVSSEIEILVLTALAHVASDDLPIARQMLAQALALAQAEGFRRLFLDEGQRMAALLRAALAGLKDEPQAVYARALLGAFGELNIELEELRTPTQQTTPTDSQSSKGYPILNSQFLVEPLSPQEQRVLRLLVAGLSNPEIAEELVVSVNTIKTQVQSIYRKLNVASRKEVRAAARRLNLH